MKNYVIIKLYNRFDTRPECEEILLKRLDSGWKIENSCYAGLDTIIYILSKEE